MPRWERYGAWAAIRGRGRRTARTWPGTHDWRGCGIGRQVGSQRLNSGSVPSRVTPSPRLGSALDQSVYDDYPGCSLASSGRFSPIN